MSTLRILIRPTLFTAGVFGTCFCGAAIADYELRKPSYRFSQPWYSAAVKQKRDLNLKYSQFRQRINEWKNQLTTGDKIAGGTIIANFIVLCAWRVPRLSPIMTKFFLSHANPTKISLSPMILSCFSHAAPIHFFLNMYVIYSFSNFATYLLGPQQLIGLFISAGAASSLTSIAYRLMTKGAMPSLGASGAVLGVIGYVCSVRPDSQLLLFFIPIAAGNAIKCIMLFDLVGLLARWKYIDHAAHFGGALFGIFYANYGEKLFFKYKKSVVDVWLKIKSDEK